MSSFSWPTPRLRSSLAGSQTALLPATLAIATLLAHLAVTVLLGAPDLLRAIRKALGRP